MLEDMGEKLTEKSISILKRPIAFLSTWRSLPPYELFSYFLMYSSVPMLVYGIQSYNLEIFRIIIFTIISLYSGFFAALIWNDITDMDIDAMSHPDRPIPSGRISLKRFFIIAVIFSIFTFIFALLISLICLAIVGFAALFVTFHDRYLKKKIKFPAFSEIFTPFQWIIVAIFGFFAIWTALPQTSDIVINIFFLGKISTDIQSVQLILILVVFTYFADNAHDLVEGIVDIKGDKLYGVKTYAISFGEKNARRISFAWFFISGILGIVLFLFSILSFVFLILFLINWIYIMNYSFKLLTADKKDISKISSIVGRKGFNYFLISYDLIFLDVFIQLLYFHLIA